MKPSAGKGYNHVAFKTLYDKGFQKEGPCNAK
jgi:hypothetical protein